MGKKGCELFSRKAVIIVPYFPDTSAELLVFPSKESKENFLLGLEIVVDGSLFSGLSLP